MHNKRTQCAYMGHLNQLPSLHTDLSVEGFLWCLLRRREMEHDKLINPVRLTFSTGCVAAVFF